MRDIKFRGLRIDKSGFVFGSLVVDPDNSYIHVVGRNKYTKSYYTTAVQVIPETVGQFTGLKDKNGKEIYEGDVLSIEIVDEDSVSGSSDFYTGAVIYGRDYKSTNKGKVTSYPCSFTIHCNDWYMEEGLLGMNNHDVEIIGNIHEEGGQDV